MAVAAQALHQQWLCFSNQITRTRPWLPARTTTLTYYKKLADHISLIPCSSSSSTSQSPEANTETAESCVNLGLQLFSKGRVCYPFGPSIHFIPIFNSAELNLCLCEVGVLNDSNICRNRCKALHFVI